MEHILCRYRVGLRHLWAFSAMKTPLHALSGIPSNREDALVLPLPGFAWGSDSSDFFFLFCVDSGLMADHDLRQFVVGHAPGFQNLGCSGVTENFLDGFQ